MLEGSIRKAGTRVRINAQLLEGATGNHIWAEKYDRELEDIFEVQDEITSTVVIEIRPAIEKVELLRIQSKAPESLDAWDYYQQGRAALYSEGPGVIEAGKFYELAESADPNFVDAVAMRHLCEVVAGYLLNKLIDADDSHKLLESLRVHNPSNDLILTTLGIIYNWYLKQTPKALEMLTAATEINPTNMLAHRYYLGSLVYSGKAEEALDYFKTIESVSPKDPEMQRMDVRRAEAYLCLREFEEAKKWGEQAIGHVLTGWPAYAVLISALGHLGDLNDVEYHLENMRSRMQGMIEGDATEIVSMAYIKKALPISDQAFIQTYISGLEKANFPQ